MKRILLALLVLSFGLAAPTITVKAQNEKAFSQTAYNPTGAITNTASDTMNVTLSYNYGVATVSAQYTRLTGTAAGTMTPYYSVDGTNWVAAGTAFTLTNVAAQAQIWNVVSAARYWRVIVTGGTTVTATVSARIALNN